MEVADEQVVAGLIEPPTSNIERLRPSPADMIVSHFLGENLMSSRISTRLTEQFDLEHPIISAPMARAAGGRLAAAVTDAGGLGLIGGGYGDAGWLEEQFRIAGNAAVGCGFITWSLEGKRDLLTRVLEHRPKGVMLSFGDPSPFAGAIAEAGVPLICQCQTVEHVHQGLAAGADVIVAQGGEAGGHGISRGTMNFVPEVVDLIRRKSPNTLVIAAGGIADGRGLAAALALGADGVLVGTRFWAASEALVHPNHHAAILRSNGDSTARTSIPDKARRVAWPAAYSIRVFNNYYIQRWTGREAELETRIAVEGPKYDAAFGQGDTENAAVIFGESAGLITAIEPAAAIIDQMIEDALRALRMMRGMVRS
jgi:nitronate monooxygenase